MHSRVVRRSDVVMCQRLGHILVDLGVFWVHDVEQRDRHQRRETCGGCLFHNFFLDQERRSFLLHSTNRSGELHVYNVKLRILDFKMRNSNWLTDDCQMTVQLSAGWFELFDQTVGRTLIDQYILFRFQEEHQFFARHDSTSVLGIPDECF